MKPHPLRPAMEAGDLAAIEATFADDIVFHSPVIHDPPFVGRASVRALLEIILEEIRDITVTHEATDGSTHILVASASVLGQPLKGTWVVEHNDAGQVREIWVMIRPLRASARIVYVVGRSLARQQGGAALQAGATVTIGGMVRYVDRVTALGSRFIKQLNRT